MNIYLVLCCLFCSLAHASDLNFITRSLKDPSTFSAPVVSCALANTSQDDCYQELAKKEFQNLSFNHTPETMTEIRGVKVLCTDEECKILDRILGGTPPANWEKKVQNCSIKTVVCILSQLFGTEEAAEIAMTVVKRNGYALSLGQEKNFYENGTPTGNKEIIWSLQELRILNDVLRVLPPEMNHLDKVNFGIKNFYRFNGINRSTAAYNDLMGSMVFYSSGLEDNLLEVKKTIVHEMCHSLDAGGRSTSTDDKNFSDQKDYGFYQYSWEKYSPIAGSLFTRKRKDADNSTFVTIYAGGGRNKAPEDFAESCAYYIMEPETLKKLNTLPAATKAEGGYQYPNKYEFLKAKVFNGAEFTGKAASPCATP